MDANDYEKAAETHERVIKPQVDSVKDALDYLQDSLRKRDLLDVEMYGESKQFYNYYIELEAFHSLLDSLFYRILKECTK